MSLEEKLELSFLIIINGEDFKIISFDKRLGDLFLMSVDGFDEKIINIKDLPENIKLFKLSEV